MLGPTLHEKESRSQDSNRERLVRQLENDLIGLSIAQVDRLRQKAIQQHILSLNSTTRKTWDALMALIIMYVAIVFPVRIGFKVASSGMWLIFEYVLNCMFLLDIVLNFRTSFICENSKEEINDSWEIAKHYLSGWFIVDVLSCIPYIEGKYNGYNWLRYAQAAKLLVLIKLLASPLFLDISSTISRKINPSFLRIIKLVFVFSFSQHVMACSYWYLCIYEQFATSWTPPLPVQVSDSLALKYTHSLHWAFIISTANNSHPTNLAENCFTCMMLYIGIIINSSIIGSAANLLSHMDKRSIERKEHLDSIRDFMRFNKISTNIHKKVIDYYSYLWNSGFIRKELALFADLPSKIKIQFSLELKRDFINKVPLFKACSTVGIIEVVQNLTSSIAMPSDIIIQEGEMGSQFYFIYQGDVSISVMAGKNQVELGCIGEGSFFGEIALLSDDKTRTASVKALSFCELELLDEVFFLHILQQFPQFKGAIDKVCNSRLQTSVNLKKMKLKPEQGRLSKSRRSSNNCTTWSLHQKLEKKERKMSVFDSVIDDKYFDALSHLKAQEIEAKAHI